jgi:Protein of unknown function (DUF3592)
MQISNHTAGLITLFVALCSFSYVVFMSIRVNESKRWPTAKGNIRDSRIEKHTGSDSDGYVLVVLYTYIVKGREYKSDCPYFYDYQTNSRRGAEKDLLMYPVGKMVTVYYNPRKPSDAVLNRNIPIWLIIFWLFFTSFLLFCGVGLLLSSMQ